MTSRSRNLFLSPSIPLALIVDLILIMSAVAVLRACT